MNFLDHRRWGTMLLRWPSKCDYSFNKREIRKKKDKVFKLKF